MAVEIGSGMTLPLFFDSVGGEENIRADKVLIQSALDQIFNIEPGERPMEKDFGSRITEVLFMNFDETVSSFAAEIASEALKIYEDRIAINFIETKFDRDEPDKLEIIVDYIVRATGEQDQVEVVVT